LERDKKPEEEMEAREWRWWDEDEESMKRAKPSPYRTNDRLGLSAIAA
jgi:hypothetical protein